MNFLPSRLRVLLLVLLPLSVMAALMLVASVRVPPAVAAQSGHDEPVCSTPQPIGAGFDYPQSAATIEGWVASRNIARARVHGWNLWAALNQNSGAGSVWQSWCTETQAFGPPMLLLGKNGLAVPAHGSLPLNQFKQQNGLKSGSEPINFPDAPVYPVPAPVLVRYKNTGCVLPPSPGSSLPTLQNGPTLQNNGDVMIAGVIYDSAAYEWIRKNRLYQEAVLKEMLDKGGVRPQMPAMPPGSIVLKPMMWPVKGSGYTALPVWDHPQSDDGRYVGFEIQGKWPRAVAVTADSPRVPPASVTYLYGVRRFTNPLNPIVAPLGPNTYLHPKVAGIEEFYNYRPDLATTNVCDRAILDASAYYAYGRMFQQGDYLVLIAMHIMTKEQPAWTFQSVWWHDRPDAGPYAANRPMLPHAAGPWQHYLMTSTYGIPSVPEGKEWPIAYNPYIELAADHPIATNCMNCHHRAAWPHTDDEYLATGGPGALAIFDQNNPAIFNGKLAVDSLWSISDRVASPSERAAAEALAAKNAGKRSVSKP